MGSRSQAAALCAPLALAGCGTYTVTPPTNLETPATAYLVDLGNTSKLILPRPDANEPTATYDEFGFGDWEFYANRNTSPLYAPFTLILPTAGTLTMRTHTEDPGLWLAPFVEHLHPITVERSAATALNRRLTDRFAAKTDTQLGSPATGLAFVRDDEHYWLFHQSSSVVADWLRDLDCRVTGWTLIADFRIRDPR